MLTRTGFVSVFVMATAILLVWLLSDENSHKREISGSDYETTHIRDENGQETVTKTIIGIDLGTTYSSVAVFKNGYVKIIADDENNRIIPSCVAFPAHGGRLVGVDAQRQLTSNPNNTVFNVKRLIGRQFNDRGVQSDMKYFPFGVIEKNKKPYIEVTVNGKKTIFAPEEISAMVLHKLKSMAEADLSEVVTNAVIAVPASFNHLQRQATKDAAIIAGLNVERLIVEPTAAALRYGLGKNVSKTILVFNMGGSTVDVSVLQIDNEVFDVRATNGNTRLGGEDFNQNVIKHLIKQLKNKTVEDVWHDKSALQKLMREMERAKRTLSSEKKATLEIENFKINNETLSRELFEEINKNLLASLKDTVIRALDAAAHTIKDIDEIVLVGGSTKIPMVRHLLTTIFNGTKIFNNTDTVEEDVAYGAAVLAGVLGGQKNTDNVVLLDVYPNSLGVWLEGNVKNEMIPRNTALPQTKSEIFSSVGTVEAFDMYEDILGDGINDLGIFDLGKIVHTPNRVDIKVTFSMDVSGLLHVSAENLITGVKKSNFITYHWKLLSGYEIYKMAQKAKTFAAEDQKIKEREMAKKNLEKEVYNMKYLFDKLLKVNITSISKKLEKTISWLDEHQEGTKKEEYDLKRKKIKGLVSL